MSHYERTVIYLYSNIKTENFSSILINETDTSIDS